MQTTRRQDAVSRRAFLGTGGVAVTSGCTSRSETTKLSNLVVQNALKSRTVSADLRVVKSGEEVLDKSYNLSPRNNTSIDKSWMSDKPGIFRITFSRRRDSDSRQITLPEESGGSCYSVVLVIRRKGLMAARSVVEDHRCQM